MLAARREREHPFACALYHQIIGDGIAESQHAVIHGYIQIISAKRHAMRSIQVAQRDHRLLAFAHGDDHAGVARGCVQHTIRTEGDEPRRHAQTGVDGDFKSRWCS